MMRDVVITAALLAALPLPASATEFDYFLKIDSIKGESLDNKHKDEIDVLEWSWGVSNAGGGIGGGGGSPRPVFAPFSWEQNVDSSIVPLFLGAASGKHFKSAVLSVRRAGENPQDFFRMTLDSVLVTSLRTQASGNTFEASAAMTYDRIEMAYRRKNADGTLGPEIKGEWNVKENKAAFSGDPAAIQGLVEAGGNLAFVSGVPEPTTWVSLAAGLGLVGAIARRRRTAPDPGGGG